MIPVCNPLGFLSSIPPIAAVWRIITRIIFRFSLGCLISNGASLFSWGCSGFGVRGCSARPFATLAPSLAPRPTRTGGGCPFLHGFSLFNGALQRGGDTRARQVGGFGVSLNHGYSLSYHGARRLPGRRGATATHKEGRAAVIASHEERRLGA